METRKGERPEQTLERIAGYLQDQTKAITSAMDAQTRELTRLSEQVQELHTRTIRLEEQRHGKDIQELTDDLKALTDRILKLELARAAGEGGWVALGRLKAFAPWIVTMITASVGAFLYAQGGTK